MIKIKIKAKGKRLTIPVPYTLLHLFIRVITSKRILALANSSIRKEGKTSFQIPNINRNDLQPLLRALAEQKGLLVAEVIGKDGTEVSIRL